MISFPLSGPASVPPLKTYNQKSPYESPWSTATKLRILLWELAWTLLCSWTPKPMNRWRLFWLRCFGAKLYGLPFVHQRARIEYPWELTLHDRACLGDRANAYCLGEIVIHEHATIAQEAYICTGTHQFGHASRSLQTAPIVVGAHAFVGARAFVMPGVSIGRAAIVGACSVVTRDVPDGAVVAGNPARIIAPVDLLRSHLGP
jgi:putative colanic acid biosynthesis acetyltransferase WcaF